MRYSTGTLKRFLLSSVIICLPVLILVTALIKGGYLRVTTTGQHSVLGALTNIIPLQPTETPTPSATPIPSPTPIPFAISLVHAPTELSEAETASFTWYISGPPTTVHTSTIYYGTVSTPGNLTHQADPESTRYTASLGDFMKGDYELPIQFIGNTSQLAPGIYYFRGYTVIDEKHYWTKEQSFIVKKVPANEVTIIDYPKTLSSGSSGSFTWDVSGPAADTGFTAIVAGKQSKAGKLSTSVATTETPYTTIVSDFTQGTTHIPLRFVGNATLKEQGTYYFRAIAFINGKNIWSDEYLFTVQ